MSENVVSFNRPEGEATAASPSTSVPHVESEYDSNLVEFSRKRATSSIFKKMRENPHAGLFTYKLARTSLSEGYEVTAVVRFPSFADKAKIDSLPSGLRKRAADLMFANTSTPGRVDPVSNMDRTTARGREVANLYCVVGFEDPKVYFTPEEADDKGGVWVEDIPFEDRWTFVRISDGEDRLASGLVAPFSGE